jgi:hypothetical protein
MDFLMTYPCYIPIRPTGEAFTFNAEGDDCLPIFTDDDLVTRFVEQATSERAYRLAIEYASALSNVLSQWHGIKSKKGRTLSHVIIDPMLNVPRARVYPIPEFIAHIMKD